MALIKLGGLAQDVRGSLNGTVFSRNRGGAFVRTKVSPVQPVTPFNTRSRQIFSTISQRWSQELTDAQRAGWDAFAATHTFINVFGDQIVLSGIAFYQSVNRRNLEAGEAYIDTAPPSFNVDDIGATAITATAVAGALTVFTITIGRVLVGNEGLYVFVTPPLIGARTPQKNDFRLVVSPTTGLFTLPATIFAAVNTRFTPLAWAAGDRIAARIAILDPDTGAISPPVQLNVTVS